MTITRYMNDCATQVQSYWECLDRPWTRISDWKVIQLTYKVAACAVLVIALIGVGVRLWLEGMRK